MGAAAAPELTTACGGLVGPCVTVRGTSPDEGRPHISWEAAVSGNLSPPETPAQSAPCPSLSPPNSAAQVGSGVRHGLRPHLQEPRPPVVGQVAQPCFRHWLTGRAPQIHPGPDRVGPRSQLPLPEPSMAAPPLLRPSFFKSLPSPSLINPPTYSYSLPAVRCSEPGVPIDRQRCWRLRDAPLLPGDLPSSAARPCGLRAPAMGVGEGCHHASLPQRTRCRFNVLRPSLSLLGGQVRLCTFLILPALGIWAVPREGQKEAGVGEGEGLGPAAAPRQPEGPRIFPPCFL